MAAGVMFFGERMSSTEEVSACTEPGPWQDSQALPSQPRRLSVSRTVCAFFLKFAWISSWQPAHVSDPAYSFLAADAAAGA